ncbi:uncharacterized protein ky [Chanos chanos]|uniref:Uncharacterized protein ky n=1 Tax=Chanos chanos TaxID=29144 RepID=A0A6J2V906_CHACN|nr:kyphoscoliosis peptidase [Chanos chanos]
MTDSEAQRFSFPITCSSCHVQTNQPQPSGPLRLIQDPNHNTEHQNTEPEQDSSEPKHECENQKPQNAGGEHENAELQPQNTQSEWQNAQLEFPASGSLEVGFRRIQETTKHPLDKRKEGKKSLSPAGGPCKPHPIMPALEGVVSRRAVFEKWAGLTCEEQRPSTKRQLSVESAAKCVSVRKRSTVTKSNDEPTKFFTQPNKQFQRPCSPTENISQRKPRKHLFRSSEVFHRVDTHAINVGRQLKEKGEFSAKSIARSVTQGARNELEKLRAIWVWLCHNIKYDLEGYLGLSQKLCSPDEVIKEGRGVCCGYSSICLEMCREVGIECQEVSGFSKGIGHQAGQRLADKQSDHMWNAVWVGGQWGLLDACWGAGTVDMETKTFKERFDDFYFLTEPSEFIETHFPDDQHWQLLSTPISVEEFEQRALKTSAFFTLGLTLTQPKQYKLTTDDGEATVSLSSSRPLTFAYELKQRGVQGQREVDSSCALLSVTHLGMNLRLLPPEIGTYELKLFARPESNSGVLRWVCSLDLECASVRPSQSLPDNPFLSWGLVASAAQLGVQGCSSGTGGEAIEVGEGGQCEVVLATSRPLMMLCELAQPDLDPAVAKRCLATQITPDKLICHVLCPHRGFYRLSVFVRDYNNNGGPLQNVGNFLLHCKNRGVNLNCLFPPDLGPWCGPGLRTQEAGLSHFSHTGGLVNMPQGRCNITFHCSSPDIQVHTVLSAESHQETTANANQALGARLNTPFPLSRYVLLTLTDNKVTVSVCVPQPGVYRLGLYGRTSPQKDYAPLCDFVLRSACELRGDPFPCAYSAWSRGCVLLEPRGGLLAPRSWVCFRVRVPGAKRVCVRGEKAAELKMNKSRVWEGEVYTGDAAQIQLAAVTTETNNMPVLMAFDVLSLENEP